MENFFYKISKVILVVPFFVLIVGLILKFNQKEINSSYLKNSKKEKKTEKVSSKTSPTPLITKNLKKIDFDFDGSYICSFKDKDIEYQLKKEKNKVILTIKQNLKKEEVDLSNYYFLAKSMIENLSYEQAESLIKSYTGKDLSLKDLLSTCQKITITP